MSYRQRVLNTIKLIFAFILVPSVGCNLIAVLSPQPQRFSDGLLIASLIPLAIFSGVLLMSSMIWLRVESAKRIESEPNGQRSIAEMGCGVFLAAIVLAVFGFLGYLDFNSTLASDLSLIVTTSMIGFNIVFIWIVSREVSR